MLFPLGDSKVASSVAYPLEEWTLFEGRELSFFFFLAWNPFSCHYCKTLIGSILCKELKYVCTLWLFSQHNDSIPGVNGPPVLPPVSCSSPPCDPCGRLGPAGTSARTSVHSGAPVGPLCWVDGSRESSSDCPHCAERRGSFSRLYPHSREKV